MNRDELIAALSARSVTDAETLCAGLDDEAVEGAIRWYDHEKFTLGKSVDKRLLAWKLREGGAPGFGAEYEPLVSKNDPVKPSGGWFQTYQGREQWINANVPDLEPDWAETAIIGLVQQKLTPTPELVREWAAAAEQDQAAHDRDCHASAQAQMKKAIQFRRMKDFPAEPEPMKKLDVSKALR